MEYKGKLYGKVGKIYFPLQETTEDVERVIEDALPLVIAFAAIQTQGLLTIHPQHQELIDRMNKFLPSKTK